MYMFLEADLGESCGHSSFAVCALTKPFLAVDDSSLPPLLSFVNSGSYCRHLHRFVDKMCLVPPPPPMQFISPFNNGKQGPTGSTFASTGHDWEASRSEEMSPQDMRELLR